jgi:hypothetical protein
MALVWTPKCFISGLTHDMYHDGLGRSVALSRDGTRLFIGSGSRLNELVADPGGLYGWTRVSPKAGASPAIGYYQFALSLLPDDGALYVGLPWLESTNEYGMVRRCLYDAEAGYYKRDATYENANGSDARSWFGFGVSVSGNGQVLAIGHPGLGGRDLGGVKLSGGYGAVYIYHLNGETGAWELAACPQKDAEVVPVPPYVGAVDPTIDAWTENDSWGCSVLLDEDGTRLLVGEIGHPTYDFTGNVYVYEFADGAWTQRQAIRGLAVDQDYPYLNYSFGWSLCGTPDLSRVFVGAPWAHNEHGARLGTVFVYESNEEAEPDEDLYSQVDRIINPTVSEGWVSLSRGQYPRMFGSGLACDETGNKLAVGCQQGAPRAVSFDQDCLPSQDGLHGVVFLFDYEYEPEIPDEEKRDREPEPTEYPEPDGGTALLFPYRPLVPVVESLAWTTDVMQAYDGTESRRGARAIPRQGWDWRVLVQDQSYYPLFRGWQTGLFWVPTWHEAYLYPDALAIATDALTIPVDVTAHGEWLDYLCIWYSPGYCQLYEITSIVGTTVTLASAIDQNYPAGSTVMPARLCRMGAQVRTEDAAPWALVELSWVLLDANALEAFQLDDAELLGDLPVAPDGLLPRALTATTEEIDFGTGELGFDVPRPESTWATDHRYYHITRSTCWDRRLWLYSVMGQRGGFWVPSGRRDLTLAAPFNAAATELTVKRLNYYEWLFSQAATDRVLFFQRVGEADSLCRVVTDVVPAGGEYQTITLASAFGFAGEVGAFYCISWLLPCRLAADRVELAWESPERMSLVLPVQEVHPYSVQV